MNDPYRTLRVNRSATPDEIQAAYRKLAMRWHPDRNAGDKKAEAKFKAVQEAWEILGDPDRRARYDATGDTSADRSEQEVQAILIAVLKSIMSKHASEAGPIWTMGGGIKHTDVVAEMRKAMETGRKQMKDEVARLTRVVETYTDAADRFTVADGEENLLRDVVRSELDLATKSLAQARRQLGLGEQSLAALKRFSYKVDRPDGQGEMRITMGDIQKMMRLGTTSSSEY